MKINYSQFAGFEDAKFVYSIKIHETWHCTLGPKYLSFEFGR